MNFRLLFFVISSIFGSGIFFVSYSLQFYTINSFISLFCSGCTALMIGFCFTQCKGSLFQFIDNNLGKNIGFFAGFLYWFICCTGTIVVVTDLTLNLASLLPIIKNNFIVSQLAFVIIITLINCFKSKWRDIMELFLNIVKTIPLILFFVLCLYFKKINIKNILIGQPDIKHILTGISKIIWCFAGIECGCFIKTNVSKTKEIILGIVIVFLLYLMSFIMIFGVLGYKINTYRPFAEVAYILFGTCGEKICSVIISILALASLNVWIIGGSEVGIDNSNLGYFPKFFQKTNSTGAFYISTLVSGGILVPLCFVSNNDLFKIGLDLVSIGYLVFYTIFCISYFKHYKTIFGAFISLLSLIFLINTLEISHVICFIFIFIISLPFYFFQK